MAFIKKKVKDARTKIFGISAICSNLPMSLWIAREIKRICADSIIILGGPQPSSIPQQILEHFDYIDIVAIGEGETILENMVRYEFQRDNLKNVSGLALRIDGKVILTPKQKLTEELDNLPYPDYSLIKMNNYDDFDLGPSMIQLEVGRGCPYSCTFCSTAVMWEKTFRVKSPPRILEEMEQLYKKYGYSSFEFIHDNFTTSKRYVAEFCDFMKKHNVHNFKWWVNSRTDCLSLERLEQMYEVGCRGLFFGIETGSDRMQKVIKKHLNFDNFEPIIQRCSELDMDNTTSFVLGFPEEMEEDIDETIWRGLHYKNLGTHRVYFAKLCPLSGTRIYNEYRDVLEETSQPSTISPQTYGLSFIQQVIHDHPDIFSSYYHVPHHHFSKDFITKLVEFAHLLVNGKPKLAMLIINKLGIGALQLFKLWDKWTEEMKIPYYDYRVFCETQFPALFQQFLEARIYGRVLPKNNYRQQAPNPAVALPTV